MTHVSSLPAQVVGIDVETTSLDPTTGEIIEFAAVRFDTTSGKEIGRFTKLCRPVRKIQSLIVAITGITNEMVEKEKSFGEFAAELKEFIANDVVFAHNASFDINYLAYHGVELSNQVWDTFTLASVAWPEAESYNLGMLTQMFDTDPAFARGFGEARQEHRAAFDVVMTWQLLARIRERLAVSAVCLDEIYDLLEKSGLKHLKPLFSVRVGYPHSSTSSEQAPTLSPNGERGIGAISRSIENILGTDGLLAEKIPGFLMRGEQLKMAKFVEGIMDSKEIGLIEAPPGTGKTYGYLVPVMAGLVRQKERVKEGPKYIISTYTRHLQDQLTVGDIPKISVALGININVAALKGRRNYLCTSRLQQVMNQPAFLPEEAMLLIKLLVWLDSGGLGDLERINVSHQSGRLLRQLHADASQCRAVCGRQNPACPYIRARRQAMKSDVLVINHALLAQMSASDGLLSGADLIIDEAHHLEEAVRDATRCDLSLTRLSEVVYSIKQCVKTASGKKQKHIAEEADELVAGYKSWLQEAAVLIGQISSSGKYRLSPAARKNSAWLNRREKGMIWRGRLQFVIGLMNGIATDTSEANGWAQSINDAEVFSDSFERFLNGDTMRIQWIDIDASKVEDDDASARMFGGGHRNAGIIQSAHLHDVSLLVRDQLHDVFDVANSVILTSATLALNGNYTYIKQRLGMVEAKSIMLKSPFNLSEQMLIYVVDDSPHPNDASYNQFVARMIIEAATLTSGRLMALFTSREAVKSAYHNACGELNRANIKLLAQNITGGRHQVVGRFLRNNLSVLLGTYGLWEGIDIPGENLSTVVIAKLPFTPPYDPVVEAMAEADGVDIFRNVSVPQMITRLRQGIGRLIRTNDDRGVIVILDARFLHADYGNEVLSSLPPGHIHIGSSKEMVETLRQWFGEKTISRWKKEKS